jgi:O-antigen/teichoic acid export membrane protein
MAAVQFAIVPTLLESLGGVRFGVWQTLQSLAGLSTACDLGIGNAAVNRIAAAAAVRDVRRVGQVVSTAVCLLAGVAVACLAAIVVIWPHVPWDLLLKTGQSRLQPETAGAIAASLAFLMLSLPLGFVEQVAAAFQRGAATNLARIAAAVATYGAVTWAVRSGAPFAAVVMASLFPALACWAAAWGAVALRVPAARLPDSRPTLLEARALLRSGLMFYAIQCCAVLGFGIDHLLVSAALGPVDVTAYAVPYRLFSLLVVVAAVTLSPLWPAYADARALGDNAWIRRTLRVSIVVTAVCSVTLAAGLVCAAPWIMRQWVGDTVEASLPMRVGMAMLVAVQNVGTAIAMYWNGTGKLRVQLLLGMAFGLVSLPLKWIGLRNWGVDSLPAVSAAAYAIVVLVPALAIVWAVDSSTRLDSEPSGS